MAGKKIYWEDLAPLLLSLAFGTLAFFVTSSRQAFLEMMLLAGIWGELVLIKDKLRK